MECFFNEDCSPKLARTPLKGEYLQALADLLEAQADSISMKPEVEAELKAQGLDTSESAIVLRNFAEFCKGEEVQKSGFSLEEVDGLLNKVIANPFTSVEEIFSGAKAAGHSAEENQEMPLMELNDTVVSGLAPGIKMNISLCVAAQEKSPDDFIEMYNQYVKSNQKNVNEILAGIPEEHWNAMKSTVAVSAVAAAITNKNSMAKLDASSPIKGLADRFCKQADLHTDELLAHVLELDLDTRAGSVRLEQAKDQFREACAQMGVVSIGRPKQ